MVSVKPTVRPSQTAEFERAEAVGRADPVVCTTAAVTQTMFWFDARDGELTNQMCGRRGESGRQC